jgi:hypothetical protein
MGVSRSKEAKRPTDALCLHPNPKACRATLHLYADPHHLLSDHFAHLSLLLLRLPIHFPPVMEFGSARRPTCAPALRPAPSRAAVQPPAPLSRGAGSFPASQPAPGSPLLPPRSHPALVAVEVGLRLVPSALGDFLAELEPPDVGVRDVYAAEEPRHPRLLGGSRKGLP